MEVVADAYDESEQAMGWFCYLQDQLRFPFSATCTAKRAISPLKIGDKIEAIDMAPEQECAHEMFITIRWEKDGLAVPLAQLQPVPDTDSETITAAEDWRYWVERNQF